ncbi:MAG: transglycosylase SLT domain-containing protein [Candidatus Anstonellales archaeon]
MQIEFTKPSLSDEEIISRLNNLKKIYPDLQVVKLIDSNSNNQKIFLYSNKSKLFIDPITENKYSLSEVKKVFNYTHKQYGTIQDNKIEYSSTRNSSLITLDKIPRLKKPVEKRSYDMDSTEIDSLISRLRKRKEEFIDWMLSANTSRGFVKINKKDAEEIFESVLKWSTERKINPLLVFAVIWQESGFSFTVKSGFGRAECRGLMQVNVGNCSEPYRLFEKDYNIEQGTKLLQNYLENYGLVNGLAAYNGGPRNRFKRVPQKYSSEVMDRYAQLVRIFGA